MPNITQPHTVAYPFIHISLPSSRGLKIQIRIPYEGCRNYIYLPQGSVYLKDCTARVYIVLKEHVMDRPYENTFMIFFMVDSKRNKPSSWFRSPIFVDWWTSWCFLLAGLDGWMGYIFLHIIYIYHRRGSFQQALICSYTYNVLQGVVWWALQDGNV